MATTFTATKAASTYVAQTGPGVIAVHSTYALTAALVINDVIEMLKVPAGATILDLILDVPDLDSHGTPTITLSVGDGTTPGRFILESTVGQAGGIVRTSVAGASGYAYTANDTIDIKVIAAPTTGATTGTLKLTAFYTHN